MISRFKIKHLVLITCSLLICNYFGVFTHLFEKDFYNDFQYPLNADIKISVDQLKHNEKPDIEPINSYDYPYITNCIQKCKNLKPRLVFLVKSALRNFDNRIAIRHSWGYEHRFSDVDIRTIFLLGFQNDPILQAKINLEYEKFADLVQINFTDSYFNNTIKTMMGFKWAVNFCPDAQFYMFVDDDMYVSTKNVLRYVRHPTNYPDYIKNPFEMAKKRITVKRSFFDFQLPNDVRLYTGYVFISSPHRHKISKWYISLDEYPYHMWPPYVTAGSYILSREALFDMYYTSFYTKHFRFDDIYIGILAFKASIEPYHCEEFNFYKKPYNNINDYRFVISSHGYDNSNELLRVWNEQKSSGNA